MPSPMPTCEVTNVDISCTHHFKISLQIPAGNGCRGPAAAHVKPKSKQKIQLCVFGSFSFCPGRDQRCGQRELGFGLPMPLQRSQLEPALGLGLTQLDTCARVVANTEPILCLGKSLVRSAAKQTRRFLLIHGDAGALQVARAQTEKPAFVALLRRERVPAHTRQFTPLGSLTKLTPQHASTSARPPAGP